MNNNLFENYKNNNFKQAYFNDNKFNQPVNNLPNSIINLTIGNNFDHIINKLPVNLKKNKFINYYNNGYNLNKITC